MGATQIHLRETHILGRTSRQRYVFAQQCAALPGLEIECTGITHASSEYAFCRLAPKRPVILGTVSGVGSVWVNGRWKECRAGEVYVTPAHAPHAYRAIKGKKWHLCWVIFEERRERTIVRSDRAQLRRASSDLLWRAITGLYDEVHGLNEAATTHHWAELVVINCRRLIEKQRIDERLLRLWSGVSTELGRPWTRESLAQYVYLGPEQLRHLCQKYFGRSPMQHLTYLRMNRAVVLLVHTNEKISAIAKDLGYENPFSFSTAFKRVIGVSPLEFSKAQGRKFA